MARTVSVSTTHSPPARPAEQPAPPSRAPHHDLHAGLEIRVALGGRLFGGLLRLDAPLLAVDPLAQLAHELRRPAA